MHAADRHVLQDIHGTLLFSAPHVSHLPRTAARSTPIAAANLDGSLELIRSAAAHRRQDYAAGETTRRAAGPEPRVVSEASNSSQAATPRRGPRELDGPRTGHPEATRA